MNKHRYIFFLLIIIYPAISSAKKTAIDTISNNNFNASVEFKNVWKYTNSTDTISIRNFKSGLEINDLWKYKIGDDHSWADADLDDSDWQKIFVVDIKKDTVVKKRKDVES